MRFSRTAAALTLGLAIGVAPAATVFANSTASAGTTATPSSSDSVTTAALARRKQDRRKCVTNGEARQVKKGMAWKRAKRILDGKGKFVSKHPMLLNITIRSYPSCAKKKGRFVIHVNNNRYSGTVKVGAKYFAEKRENRRACVTRWESERAWKKGQARTKAERILDGAGTHYAPRNPAPGTASRRYPMCGSGDRTYLITYENGSGAWRVKSAAVYGPGVLSRA